MLIQSFKLNLLDIKSSDLVLLLFEITDPILTLKLKIIEGINLLKDIGVSHNKILIVFNKLDKAPELEHSIGEDIDGHGMLFGQLFRNPYCFPHSSE